jgi:hypothetical protein
MIDQLEAELYEFITEFCKGITWNKQTNECLSRTGYVLLPSERRLLAEQLCAIRYMPKEICICAAVKVSPLLIVRGHRHSDCIRNIAGRPNAPELLPVTQKQQGFMTSFGRFVGRAEGAKLQNAAGIVSYRTGKPVVDLLFSEDLY